MSIRADANRRHRYSFGAGYGTDTDVRGTLQWEDRRINTRGPPLQRRARRRASQQQSLESHYIIPIGDPALEKLAFETTLREARARRPRHARLQLRAQHHPGAGPLAVGVVRHGAPTRPRESAVREPHGHAADPRHQPRAPCRRATSARRCSRAASSRSCAARTTSSARTRTSCSSTCRRSACSTSRPSGTCCCAAKSARASSRSSASCPASVRFFAGGDRSVRGFGYNELSPDHECRAR